MIQPKAAQSPPARCADRAGAPAVDAGLLDGSEAAGRLRVSKRTLETWRQRGSGPKFLKLGGRVFYRPSDLDDFLAVCVRTSTAGQGHAA